jgi:hypothetical protein
MDVIENKTMATGLALAGFAINNQQDVSANDRRFKSMYGSSALVVSKIWHDLCTTEVEDARIASTDDIKMFFLALHFLKCYPTEELLSGKFKMSEKSCRKWIWYYIKKVQALKVKKVS